MLKSEKSLQNKVIKYFKDLQDKGYKLIYEKRQAGGYSYKVGLPDLWVVINGIHIEIELKDPKKEIQYKSEQLYWVKKLNNLNIKTIISNDFNEIKSFIDKYLK